MAAKTNERCKGCGVPLLKEAEQKRGYCPRCVVNGTMDRLEGKKDSRRKETKPISTAVGEKREMTLTSRPRQFEGPNSEFIGIRLPESLADHLKAMAHKKGVALSEFVRWILLNWTKESADE